VPPPHAFYLDAIARDLRSRVLPHIVNEEARDVAAVAARALTSFAYQLSPEREADSGRPLPPLPFDPPATPSATLDHPAHDLATTGTARPLVQAAVHWIERQDRAMPPGLLPLLDWERGRRRRALDAIDRRLDDGPADAPKVGDVTIATLGGWLRTRPGLEAAQVQRFRLIGGGRARQTAAFELHVPGEPVRHLVIQRDNPGLLTPGRRGVTTEGPLLRHVAAFGMRVASPIWVEPDTGPLGAAFMIGPLLPGTKRIAGMDYFAAPDASPSLARDLAAQMAKLHRIPIEGAPAAMNQSPQGAGWASELDEYHEQWTAFAPTPSIAVAAAFGWMRHRAGRIEDRRAIVHGDMLFQNLLCDGDTVSGITDWELARIGHPAEDLCYVRPVIEGILPWADFLAAYHDAGGPEIPTATLDYFTLRSLVWLMVQVGHARHAFEQGLTTDPYIPELAAYFLPRTIDRLSDQLMRMLGAGH
jgi:aminoglycoside phosphotransferase (APT) family kinase protein